MRYQVNRIDPDDTTKQIVEILENVVKVEYHFQTEFVFYSSDGSSMLYGSDWILNFKVI